MLVSINNSSVILTLSGSEYETLKNALSIYTSRMRASVPYITDEQDKIFYSSEATQALAMLLSAHNPTYAPTY